MIDKLKKILQLNISFDEPNRSPEYNLQLVCAALFIEVMHADHKIDPKEEVKLIQLLQTQWMIPKDTIDKLIIQATTAKENATSLYQFTQVINSEMSEDEKFELIKSMWSIAYADEQLHKYEEHLIRQVADLIHLPHVKFMRAKHDAKNES